MRVRDSLQLIGGELRRLEAASVAEDSGEGGSLSMVLPASVMEALQSAAGVLKEALPVVGASAAYKTTDWRLKVRPCHYSLHPEARSLSFSLNSLCTPLR